MIRRSARLTSRYSDGESQSVNPLESVANMTDVMLVLAVALMLALIAHWSIDVSSVTEVDESQMQAADDSTAAEVKESASDKVYEEVGKVYRDPDTGQTFIIEGTE
jgi:hypothetical protein